MKKIFKHKFSGVNVVVPALYAAAGLFITLGVCFLEPKSLFIVSTTFILLTVLVKKSVISIVELLMLFVCLFTVTFYWTSSVHEENSAALIWFVNYCIMTIGILNYLTGNKSENVKNPLALFFVVYSLYFVFGFLVWSVWEFLIPLPDFIALDYASMTMLRVGYAGLITLTICGIVGRRMAKKSTTGKSSLPDMKLNPDYLSLLSWLILLAGFVAAYLLFDGFKNVPLWAAEAKDQVRIEVVKNSSGFVWVFYMLLIYIPSILYIKSEGKFNAWRISYFIKCILSLSLLSLYGGRFFMLAPIALLVLMHMHNTKVSMKLVGLFLVAAMVFSMWFIGYRIYGSDVDLELALRAFFVDFFPEMRMFAAAVRRVPEHNEVGRILQNLVMGNIPSKLAELVDLDKRELFRPIGAYTSSLFPEYGEMVGIRLSWIGEWYITGGMISVIGATSLVSLIVGYMDGKLSASTSFQRKFKYIVLSFFYVMIIPYGTNFIITIMWMHVLVFLLFGLLPHIFNKVFSAT